MKTTSSGICAVLLLVSLTACGGRVANPVAQSLAFDEKLTCSHHNGEYENNAKRLVELVGERKDRTRDNFGMLISSPLFLDLSATNKKEVTALDARNTQIIALMTTKKCAFHSRSSQPNKTITSR